jgi:putative ABC transport system ATP-binding protein
MNMTFPRSSEAASPPVALDSAAEEASSVPAGRFDSPEAAGKLLSELPHPIINAAISSVARRFPVWNILMLIARDLEKTYRSGERNLTVLRDVDLHIEAGDFVAILGPSGSGKTTLLGLLAGLDTATRGSVRIAGTDLAPMSEDQRARFRRATVGFVFQSFQLIPSLTAQENVQVPLELRGDRGVAERAANLLARVGLGDRLGHYPAQLSGGEQQRVALARAFVNEPRILFADEPTGNLDAVTGEAIVGLMEELNRERGTTLVLVTHDPVLAERARRTIRLADGVIVSDTAAAA